MACDEVFQETSKTSVMDQGQHNSRDQSCHPTSFETQQRQVNHLRGWKTPTSSVRDATLMVHFDTEQMQFAGRSQQFLWDKRIADLWQKYWVPISNKRLKTVLFALNMTVAFSLASLLQNMTLAFKCDSSWEVNCASLRYNMRPTFSLLWHQNARAVFHSQNVRAASAEAVPERDLRISLSKRESHI